MALRAINPTGPPAQAIKLLTIAQLMTPEQCADFLQVQVDTLYTWVSQRRIPFRKLGPGRNSALRFDFAEVLEWSKGASQ